MSIVIIEEEVWHSLLDEASTILERICCIKQNMNRVPNKQHTLSPVTVLYSNYGGQSFVEKYCTRWRMLGRYLRKFVARRKVSLFDASGV